MLVVNLVILGVIVAVLACGAIITYNELHH